MSAAVEVTRKDYSPAELRALVSRNRNPDQARRLLAIAIVLEGGSWEDAARHTGMNGQSKRKPIPTFPDFAVGADIASGLLGQRCRHGRVLIRGA